MLSVTPTLNSINDIHSLASLAWAASKLDLKLPNSVEWKYAVDIYQPYGRLVTTASSGMTRAERRAYRVKVKRETIPEQNARIDEALFEMEKHVAVPL